MSPINIVKEFFLSLWCVLLSTVLIVLVVLVFPPLYLIRYGVSLICPLFRSDLLKMMHPRSAIHAVDTLHTNPQNTELLFVIVEGPVDVDIVREEMMRRIENLCPRLKTYFVKWMGYYFWKKDLNFHIKNHMNYFTDPNNRNADIDTEITESQLYSHHNYLLTKSYKKDQSPWEILVVKNYQPKNAVPGKRYSALVSMFHHSMGDGYGLFSIFFDTNKHAEMIKLANWSKKVTMLDKLVKLVAVASAPYQFIRSYHDWMDGPPFVVPFEKRAGNYNMATVKFSLADVKKVQSRFGVTFTATYLAAITGGLREFMLENQHSIPKCIHSFFPLPIPGKLKAGTNNITFGCIPLPVGIPDSVQRLYFLHEKYESLKKSILPQFSALVPMIGGALPSILTKSLVRVKIVSGVISNFPGPLGSTTFLKYPMVDIDVSGNLMGGNSAMAFANISYNGSSRIIVIGDCAVFPSNLSMERILENFRKEIKFLCADEN